jgi:predicted DsbA family dithiol-disulfide isomerase
METFMITVEIVSDVVCPWCFIGLRRLDAAIAEVKQSVPDFNCRKLWRPFFLNPNTPPEGEPYLPFLERKFGGRSRVEALFERVRLAGRLHGIAFAFEKIQVRANTLNAHRLIHWAQARGDVEPLVQRLFAAQFLHGENLSDQSVLVTIAAVCGYDKSEVECFLDSGRDADAVGQMERTYREMGVSMVPTFIVDKEAIIVGAENPSVLAEAILKRCPPSQHAKA